MKTPAATEVTASARTSAIMLTTRQRRALDAIAGGWIMREALDRAAGCSNSPDLVRQLREKLGHGAIEMEHVDATDRDGRPCRPGRYRLTDVGHARLAEMGGAPC